MSQFAIHLDNTADGEQFVLKAKRMPALLLVAFALQIASVINLMLPFELWVQTGLMGRNDVRYAIHLGVLDLTVMSLLLWRINRFPRDPVLIFAMFALLVSGIVTQAIFAAPQTYFFYVVSFLFAALYAYQDLEERNQYELHTGWMPLYMAGIFVAGLWLITVDPRWGKVPFEFSRTSRGVVMLWWAVSLYPILPCVTVVMLYMRSRMRYFYLGLSIAMLIILISTYTRTWVVQSMAPLVLYAIFRLRTPQARVMFIGLISVLVFGLFFDNIIDWFTLASPTGRRADIEGALTGRLYLWTTYLRLFVENPIFGFGWYNLVLLGLLPSKGATTEVGILAWFANFGLIFALPMLWILGRATIQATRNIFLRQGSIHPLDLFCSVALLTTLPSMVLQEASRIIYINDFVVYGSMFYLYYSAGRATTTAESSNLQ